MKRVSSDYRPIKRPSRSAPNQTRGQQCADKTTLARAERRTATEELSLGKYPTHYFCWKYGLSTSAVKLMRKGVNSDTPERSSLTMSLKRTMRWQVSWQRCELAQRKAAEFKLQFDKEFDRLRQEDEARRKQKKRSRFPRKHCRRCGRELFATQSLFRRGKRFRNDTIERYWYPDCLLCEKDKHRFSCEEKERPTARLEMARRLSHFVLQCHGAFPVFYSETHPLTLLRRTPFFRQCEQGAENSSELRTISEQFVKLYGDSDLNLLLAWLEEMHFDGEAVLREAIWQLDEHLRRHPRAHFSKGKLNSRGKEVALLLFRCLSIAHYAIHLLVVNGADNSVDISAFG